MAQQETFSVRLRPEVATKIAEDYGTTCAGLKALADTYYEGNTLGGVMAVCNSPNRRVGVESVKAASEGVSKETRELLSTAYRKTREEPTVIMMEETDLLGEGVLAQSLKDVCPKCKKVYARTVTMYALGDSRRSMAVRNHILSCGKKG